MNSKKRNITVGSNDDNIHQQQQHQQQQYSMIRIRLFVSVLISIFIYFAFVSESNILEHQQRFYDGTVHLKDRLYNSKSNYDFFQVTLGGAGVIDFEQHDINFNDNENKQKQLRLIQIPSSSSTSMYMNGADPETFIHNSNIDHDTMMNDPEEGMSTEDKNGELYKFFKSTSNAYSIVLLKWDTTGRLVQSSPIDNVHWLPIKAQAMFDYIEPSINGRIALLLNTNVINGIDWTSDTNQPPVPLFVYTIPTLQRNKNNYYVIPHPYDRDGYSRACVWHAEQNEIPFNERIPIILWRGTTHNLPNRIKLLQIANNDNDNKGSTKWLDAIDISVNDTGKMERPQMVQYKYQLVIGGESGTAWASLRWKMCTPGTVVFKVDSWSQDWWYDTLIPYKHYVPIKKDLSNLKEQYIWAQNHPNEIQSISNAGSEICKDTLSEDWIESYLRTILQTKIPEATLSIIHEADKLLDGMGNIWRNIPKRTVFNKTAIDILASEDPLAISDNVLPIIARKRIQSNLIVDDKPTKSIIRFLESARHPHMISLLKWNSSGILDKMSPVDKPDWFPDDAITLFQRTGPSHYGTVAFFINTDILSAVPWDVLPPIPIITYTLPNKCIKYSNIGTEERDDKHYFITPNPYDRDYDFNRECIKHAETTTKRIPYHQRKNTIIWRGTIHGKADRVIRMKLCEMSKREMSKQQQASKKNNKNNNDNNNHTWLDASTLEDGHVNMYMQRDEISQYKYQIDIGGESGTTWGSLRWKMCSGNLVFKVDSWSQDWWHNTLVKNIHYLSIKSDLSNLKQQYDWAESHPKEVTTILQNAISICKDSSTIESIVSYQKHLMKTLPRASEIHSKEADAILDGLGSFYQPIIDRDNI